MLRRKAEARHTVIGSESRRKDGGERERGGGGGGGGGIKGI